VLAEAALGKAESSHGRRLTAPDPEDPALLPYSEAAVSETLDSLILDLLEWIGPVPRPYSEVMEAWRTSCPQLAVWEEADRRGFLARARESGGREVIGISALGAAELRKRSPAAS